MKHISILVPRGDCSLTNIEGTHQILRRVNGYLQEMGRQPLFTTQLVGQDNEIRELSCQGDELLKPALVAGFVFLD
jgi:hypothetical protein